MKNPYLYGYLPFFTIFLLSLTFGIFAVNESTAFMEKIGVYSGMRQFLSDFQLRLFLLIVSAFIFFMLFSALKLIGETIHEVAMLFFSKDQQGESIHVARSGNIIFFVGALASIAGMNSLMILIGIVLISILIYFIFTVYKLSQYMSLGGLIGLIAFEIVIWALLLSAVAYVILKLYNGLLASLPFIK